MHIFIKKTPTDPHATGSCTHPTDHKGRHARPAATAVAQAAAHRYDRFASTTPLSRTTAFAAAGPCLERGTLAARRRVSGLYAFPRVAPLARVATAVARARARAPPLHCGGAAAGVARHNPILHACIRACDRVDADKRDDGSVVVL